MSSNEIPNADLIRAVLDGKVVQWQQPDGQWAEPDPNTAISLMVCAPWRNKPWRIKPEPVTKEQALMLLQEMCGPEETYQTLIRFIEKQQA